MHLELRYCSMWGYEPQAVSLTSKLLTTFKQQIQDLILVPASGGCFELSADGELIYSKLKTKKFPDEQKMIELLGGRLKAKKWSMAGPQPPRLSAAMPSTGGSERETAPCCFLAEKNG
jgi:selenoprotein W-related protein